jgi:deoxyribonuclease (pyrimidine dimer)
MRLSVFGSTATTYRSIVVTRINVGIDPVELPDRLLLAEHREITRVPNAVTSGRAKLDNPPARFTLGSGHVRFFYTRLGYLSERYRALFAECRRRGFDVTDKSTAFRPTEATQHCFGNYRPTGHDRSLLIERIHQRGFELLPQHP